MDPDPPRYAQGQLRDRLANERTLLAWLRTALALMGFGLVVAKFSLFAGVVAAPPGGAAGLSHALGVVMVIAGVLVMAVGGQRTRAYARIIDPDAQHPSDRPLALTVGAVIVLGALLAVYLIVTGS